MREQILKELMQRSQNNEFAVVPGIAALQPQPDIIDDTGASVRGSVESEAEEVWKKSGARPTSA